MINHRIKDLGLRFGQKIPGTDFKFLRITNRRDRDRNVLYEVECSHGKTYYRKRKQLLPGPLQSKNCTKNGGKGVYPECSESWAYENIRFNETYEKIIPIGKCRIDNAFGLIVRCLEHNNTFKVLLGDFQRGRSKGCRANPDCVLNGLEVGKTIGELKIINTRFYSDYRRNTKRNCEVEVECPHLNRYWLPYSRIKSELVFSCRGRDECKWSGLKWDVTIPLTHWTPIKECTPNRHGKKRFLAKCVCGKIKPVVAADVFNGKSTNCGCVQKHYQITAITGLIMKYNS